MRVVLFALSNSVQKRCLNGAFLFATIGQCSRQACDMACDNRAILATLFMSAQGSRDRLATVKQNPATKSRDSRDRLATKAATIYPCSRRQKCRGVKCPFLVPPRAAAAQKRATGQLFLCVYFRRVYGDDRYCNHMTVTT